MVAMDHAPMYAKNLHYLVKVLGVKSSKELADAMGMTTQGIDKICRGETKVLQAENLVLFSENLGVDERAMMRSDLQKAKFDPRSSDSLPPVIPAGDWIPKGYLRLPKMEAAASAGPGRYVDGQTEIVEYIDVEETYLRTMLHARRPERVRIVPAHGFSMSPTIQDKDLMFVDESEEGFDLDGIYTLVMHGSFRVKRLNRRTDGYLDIISDNPAYPREVLNEDNADGVRIVGYVLGWWTLRRV